MSSWSEVIFVAVGVVSFVSGGIFVARQALRPKVPVFKPEFSGRDAAIAELKEQHRIKAKLYHSQFFADELARVKALRVAAALGAIHGLSTLTPPNETSEP